MAPYWRIRRERVGDAYYVWRIYYLGQRSAAFWTWERCIEYVDHATRTLHGIFGGRL